MSIADKVASLVSSADGDVPGAGPAPDAAAGSPTTGATSGAGSAPDAPQDAGSPKPAVAAPGATNPVHELLLEKLAKTREERRSQRVLESARQQRDAIGREAEAAKVDREAAAAERARWENLKSGNFLDGIKASGRDPAKVFAELQREAVEAGTPEAQMRRMRDEFDRQLAEQVGPLRKTIEDLTEREKSAKAETEQHAFASDFTRTVSDDAYGALRDEYPDERLLSLADGFRSNPNALRAQAARLGVRLPDPQIGFTMKDILNVLKAAQDEHEAGKTTRRAARTATNPSTAAQQAPTAQATVNGTAERRNAGASTLGNDLASSTASTAKPSLNGMTPAARVRERVRRMGG